MRRIAGSARVSSRPRPSDSWALRASLALVVLLAPALASADASTRSRALTRQGYAEAYELNFPESLTILADAHRVDPRDPAPKRAIAAVTWMEILFAQGVVTFEAFQGGVSGDHVQRPTVDPALATRFLGSVRDAIQLAEQQSAVTPADADALYQLGASTVLACWPSTGPRSKVGTGGVRSRVGGPFA